MSLKRLTSLFLAITMIAGMLVMPQSALAIASDEELSQENIYVTNATEYPFVAERADLTYKILGTSDNIDLTKDTTNFVQGEYNWKQGNYLWIGLEISKGKNSRFANMIYGVDDLSAGVLYNNKYLSFDPGSATTMFNSLTSVLASTSDGKILKKNYKYDAHSIEKFSSETYNTLINNSRGGTEEILMLPTTTTGDEGQDEDFSEAYLKITNSGQDSWILESADAKEHLLLAYAFYMETTEPPENTTVIQGYANHSTMGFVSDTTNLIYAQIYPGEGTRTKLMNYYFTIKDEVRGKQPDSVDKAKGDPKQASLTEKEATFERGDTASSGYADQTFNYTANDTGGLARLWYKEYDGTAGEDFKYDAGFDYESGYDYAANGWTQLTEDTTSSGNGYTKTTDSETGITTVVLPKAYLASAFTNAGNYTLRFETNAGTGDNPVTEPIDPAALLTVEDNTPPAPAQPVKLTINETGTIASGEDGITSVTHITYDSNGAPTTENIVKDTDSTYHLTAGETYTINAKYKENVAWSWDTSAMPAESTGTGLGDPVNTPTTPGTDYPGTSAITVTIGEAEDGSEYTLNANFGLTDPTLTITKTGNGTITVTQNSASILPSGNVYTLGKYDGDVTITASADDGYVFGSWSDPSGDLTDSDAADRTGTITFSPTIGMDSAISITFNQLADKSLKLTFADSTINASSKVEVYKENTTGSPIATLYKNDGTTQEVNIKENTDYVLVATPVTSVGEKFTYWNRASDGDNTTTFEFNSGSGTDDVEITANFAKKTKATLASDIKHDRKTDKTKDEVFTYTENDYPTISKITLKKGSTTKEIASSNYTIENGTTAGTKKVTIKAAALQDLDLGEWTLIAVNGVSDQTSVTDDGATVTITISDASLNTISVDPMTFEYSHGDKITLNGMKVTLAFEDSSKNTYYTYSTAKGGWLKGTETETVEASVPFKVVYSDSTTDTFDDNTAVASGVDVMRLYKQGSSSEKQHDDLAVYVVGTEGAHEGASATAGTIQVSPKALNITGALSAPVSRTYNQGTDIGTSKVNVSIAEASQDDIVSGDAVNVANAQVDGSFSTTAADTGKPISYTVTLTGDDAGNYTVGTKTALTGTINPIALTVGAISNIPETTVGAVKSGSGTATVSAADNADHASDTATLKDESNAILAGESVTFTYNYEYTAANVTTSGEPVITITSPTSQNSNYTVTTSGVKGSVSAKNVTGIALTTKTTYDYAVKADHKLDLSDTYVTVTYGDTTSDKFNYDTTNKQWVNDTTTSWTISLDDMPLTWNEDGTTAAEHDEAYTPAIAAKDSKTKLYVSYSGKKANQAITATKITINSLDAPEATGSKDKIYDSDKNVDNVSAWAVAISTPAVDSVLADDYDKLAISTASATASYDNKNVGTGKTITLSGLALTDANGVADADKVSGNYILGKTSVTTTGNITQRDLTLTKIENIPAATQYDLTTKEAATKPTAASSNATTGAKATFTGVQGSDVITMTFNYAYTDAQVNDENVVGKYAVTLAKAQITDQTLTGDSNTNYNLIIADEPEYKGTVNGVSVTGATLTASHKTDYYTYIDNDKLDLTGTVVTVTYGGTTSHTYTAKQESDGTVKWKLNSSEDYNVTNPPFTLVWSDSSTVTPNQTLKPSEIKNLTMQVKVGANKYSNESITVAPKALTLVHAEKAEGTIEKYYNGNANLTTANNALLSYKAGYTDSESNVVYPAGVTASVTASYGGTDVGTENLVYTINSISDTTNYSIANSVGVTTADGTPIQGTINAREIKVTVINNSSVGTKNVIDSDKTANLTTTNGNYTVSLDKGNTGESNAFVSGDGVSLKTNPVTFTNTLGEQTWTIPSVTAPETSDYFELDGTKKTNYKLSVVGATVKGTLVASNYTLKVTANNGTVTVKDADTNAITGSNGSYSLQQTLGYTVEVAPASGYEFTGWTDTSFKSFDAAVVTTGDANATSIALTMPGENLTATANFKLIPKWHVTPTQIDKSKDLTLQIRSDYVPATVTIGGVTFTKDTDFTVGTNNETVTLPAAKVATIPDLTQPGESDAANLTMTFTGTEHTLTAKVGAENAAPAVTTLTRVKSPTKTEYTYGETLELDGMEIDLTTTQTNTVDKVTTYKYVKNTGWVVKNPGDADFSAAAVSLDSKLNLAWSDTHITGTPDNGDNLKPSVHNNTAIKVTYNNDAVNAKSTDPLTVNKKKLTVTVSGSGISKTYDATAALGKDASDVDNEGKINITVEDQLTSDTDVKATLTSSAFTKKNSSSKAAIDAEDNKPIEIKFKLSGTNINEYYVESATETLSTKTFTNTTDVKGNITAREITISDLLLPSISVGDSETTKGYTNISYTNFKTNATLSDEVLSADTDKFTFSVKGTYASNGPSDAGNSPTFNKTTGAISSTPSGGDYVYEVSSVYPTALTNYSFVWPDTATGFVQAVTIENMVIYQQPTQTKTATAATHGDALDLNSLIVRLTVKDSTDPIEVAYGSPEWTAYGLKLSWKNGTGHTTSTTSTVNGSPASRYVHDGAKLSVSVDTEDGPLTRDTDAFIVNPIELTVNVTASGVAKEYDGTTAITTGTLTPAIASGVAATGDDKIVAANIVVSAAYPDIHKGDGKALTTPTLSWNDTAAEQGANYTLKLGETSAWTGNITARPITISQIDVDKIFVRGTNKDRSETALNITDSKVTIGSGSVATGDTVKIAFTAAYDDVSTDADPANLPLSATNWSVTGKTTEKDDYAITFPANATGKIEPKTPSGVQLTSQPDKKKYIHGETLDLTGMQLTVSYSGGNDETYTYGTSDNGTGWFLSGKPIASDAQPVAAEQLPSVINLAWNNGADTTVTPGAPVRYDSDHFVSAIGNIIVNHTTASSVEITVEKRPVNLEIAGAITKEYDSTLNYGSSTVTTPITYKWTETGETADPIAKYDEGNLTVDTDATTLTYNVKNVHAATDGYKIKVGVAYTAAHAALADNYTITVVNNTTTAITPATLKVTAFTDVPVVKTVGDEVTGTLTAPKGKYTTADGFGAKGTDNLTVVYPYTFGEHGTDGKADSVTVNKNGDATLTGLAAGNYTLEVPATITGKVINKAINGITVTPPKTVYTHGETFDLTGAKIQLNYSNTTNDTFTYGTNGTNKGWFAGETVPTDGTTAPVDLFAATGVTSLKWLSAAGTDVTGSEKMRYDDADLNSTTHKKPIYITYKNDGEDAVSAIFANVEVQQKTIDKIVVTKTADFTKTYDATKNVVAGGATYAAQADVAVDSDVIALKANVAYPTEKANRDKDGNALSTPIADYAMAFTNAAFDNSGTNNNGNYKLASNVQFVNAAGEAVDVTGTIKKLEITFESVPAPQAVQKVGTPTDTEKTLTKVGATIGEATANANTYIILAGADYTKMPAIDMANLKADYTVTYADASITTPISGSYETLETTGRRIYSLDSTSVFDDNYEINWPTLNAETKGIVVPNAIDFVGDITPPTAMRSYHTDNIKLEGMEFEIKYEASLGVSNRVFKCGANDQWTMTTDGAITNVNLADYGISIIWTTSGTEAAGMTRKNIHDGQTLTVKAASTDDSATDGYITKATTNTYAVDALPVYAKVTTGEIEKVYDGTKAVEQADKNDMSFTFFVRTGANHTEGTELEYANTIGDVFDIDKTAMTAEYASKNVKKTAIAPVEIAKQAVTLSNLALTGDNAENYELKTTDLSTDINDEAIEGKITRAPFEITVTGVPAIWNSETNRTNLELDSQYYTVSGYKNEDGTEGSASYFTIDKVMYSWPDVAANATSASITFDDSSFTLTGEGTTEAAKYARGVANDPEYGGNYDFSITPAVSGTINAVTVTGMTVSGPAKTRYTHRDDVELDGLKVTISKSDSSTATYTYTNQNDVYSWLDETDTPVAQPFGDSEAVISYVDSDDAATANALDDPENGLIHLTHNDARVKVTAGDLSGISTDKLTVDQKPLYATAFVKPDQHVGKQYDNTPALGADDGGTDNKSKLDYTLVEKVEDEYRDYTIPEDEEGKLSVSGAAATAKFVKNNADESNVQFDGSGWTLFAVDFSDSVYNRILPLDIAVTGLTLTGDASGNYTLDSTAVGDKPQGKIYPRDITLEATEIGAIKSDYEGERRTVSVTDYTPKLSNTDVFYTDQTANIEFIWTATYDADGQATVNNAQAKAQAKAAAINPTAVYNYDFKFTGSPDSRVTEPEISSFTIEGQPEYTKSQDAVYGDKVSEKGGVDGLEIAINYDVDPVTGDAYKTTHHKLVDGDWFVGTIDGVKYEELPEGVSFKWNDDTEGTPVTDVNDLTDPILTRGTDKNKLSVTVDIDGTPTTKTTDGINPAKRPVSLNVAGTYTKDYDGTDTIQLDTENPEITVTVNPDDIVEGENVAPATKPGMKFTTADVTDNNPIILDWTGVTLDNDNYEIKTDDEDNIVYTADDTFTAGAITAKTIRVTITVPTITSGGAAEVSGTVGYSATADTAKGSFVTENVSDIPDKDKANIQLTYSGTRDTNTNTGTAAINTNVTLDPAIPTVTGDGIKPSNYVIESATATGTINPVVDNTPKGRSSGGGGGSTNKLTVTYENEDGSIGNNKSTLTVPMGTAPKQLTATFTTALKDSTVIWASSDENVATVDENGLITFVGEGDATVTATSKSNKQLKDTIKVKVTPAETEPTPTPAPDETPAPTEKPQRTHERVTDSLITKTMLNPYIVGYDDYVFGPELPISREELSAIFARLIANNLYMDQDYDTSFPDVPEKWSKSYIGYLEGFNVVTGYEDGTFRPENYITRAEMAVMMAKAEGYDITPDISADELDFPDVDEGYARWSAAKAIQIMSDLGIMSGYTDGTFRPGQPITRAETVATINRVLAAQEVADYDVLPSDVTEEHWAYNDIVFAMNHRILKDAAADPNEFIWSEEFDKNMINITEKGETVTETVTSEEETSSEETAAEEDKATEETGAEATADGEETKSESDTAATE